MDETRPWPRYELIDGQLLVTPAPGITHQRAVRDLVAALATYVHPHRLGEVLMSPADIALEPESVLQPDVFVIPAGAEPPRRWSDVHALLLAVEILSPSSARYDRVTKRRFFQRVGVPEYWVVDLDARAVERWHPGDERAELLDERLTWQPEGAGEPFALDLASFFSQVWPKS
jgi:Uma2 family endonuclease